MAQVSLRTCENEIRGLIGAGDFDKAITVGQHVLQYYPKYLIIYGFLAEACLGKGFYDEAADLFSRILAVDPESVSARMGLSQVYEATGNIAEAIVQMRAAFDLAPSLKQTHRELRRLLQLESGELPPKLKLSRQGLGRIYLRGELYTQAADEFEALLRENPDQIDVEVSLAEALWRDSQRIRAIEVCQNILNKLPYCLKAHLILAETWMRSDREDEAQAHIKFIREIDPEGALAYRFMGEASPVPQVSVTLPEPTAERVPDRGDQIPQITVSPYEEEREAVSEFLASTEEAGKADIAEIPEWLQEAKPVGVEKTLAAPVSDLVQDVTVSDWLTTGVSELAVAPEEAETVTAGIPEGEPGEWLMGGTQEQQAVAELEQEAESPATAAPVSEQAITEEELLAQEQEEPTWLRILREEGLEAELPEDVLASMQAQVPPEVSQAAGPAETGEAEAEVAELPLWLQELQAGEPLEEAEAGLPAAPVSEQAITEEELLAQEQEEPTWLRILREEGLEAELPEDVLAAKARLPEIGLPSEASLVQAGLLDAEIAMSQEPEDFSAPTVGLEATPPEPTLPEEVGLVHEPPAGQAEAPAEELPDWLVKAAQDEGLLSEIEGSEFQETMVEKVIAEQIPPEPLPQQADEGIVLDESEQGDEETPDWLKLLQQEETPQAVVSELTEESSVSLASPSVTEEEELEIPEWLQILRQGQSTGPGALAVEPATPVAQMAPGKKEEVVAEAQLSEMAAKSGESLQAAEPPAEHETTDGLAQIKTALRQLFPDAKAIEEKIAHYEQALKDDPKDHLSRWKLVEAYVSLDKHAAAVAHCDQLVQSGEFIDQVIQYLEKLSQAEMPTRQVYQVLGDAYFKQDRLLEAAEVYRKALSQLAS